MANNKKLQVALTAVLVLMFIGVVYLGYQAVQPPEFGGLGDEKVADAREPRDPIVSPRTDGVLDPDSGDVIVGGVERPATDVTPDETQPLDDSLGDGIAGTELDYGVAPSVDPDANEQVALAVEAIQNGTHPERLNAGVGSKAAANFDPAKFDPESESYDEGYRQAYLRTPEPGRVWHPAQPGPGVKRIRPLMPAYAYVKQGEDITLRVSGVPDQPVTFTSFDLGMFENKLTTITVTANAQGVAEATFHGASGTADDVKILAASPVMSGQARLRVHVIGPNDARFSE